VAVQKGVVQRGGCDAYDIRGPEISEDTLGFEGVEPFTWTIGDADGELTASFLGI
jgi:hypothetical protein